MSTYGSCERARTRDGVGGAERGRSEGWAEWGQCEPGPVRAAHDERVYAREGGAEPCLDGMVEGGEVARETCAERRERLPRILHWLQRIDRAAQAIDKVDGGASGLVGARGESVGEA